MRERAAILARRWAQGSLRASGIVHFRTLAELAESLRMRVYLAQLLAAPADTALFRQVQRSHRIRRWRRQPRRVCEALLTEAALHSLAGDDAGGRRCWRRALRHCERHDLWAHLAAIRLRLAGHTRGREALEHETLALVYLEEQGIGERERFVRSLAPARAGSPAH